MQQTIQNTIAKMCENRPGLHITFTPYISLLKAASTQDHDKLADIYIDVYNECSCFVNAYMKLHWLIACNIGKFVKNVNHPCDVLLPQNLYEDDTIVNKLYEIVSQNGNTTEKSYDTNDLQKGLTKRYIENILAEENYMGTVCKMLDALEQQICKFLCIKNTNAKTKETNKRIEKQTTQDSIKILKEQQNDDKRDVNVLMAEIGDIRINSGRRDKQSKCQQKVARFDTNKIQKEDYTDEVANTDTLQVQRQDLEKHIEGKKDAADNEHGTQIGDTEMTTVQNRNKTKGEHKKMQKMNAERTQADRLEATSFEAEGHEIERNDAEQKQLEASGTYCDAKKIH